MDTIAEPMPDLKVLLVDNDSDTWDSLVKLCRHNDFVVDTIHARAARPDSAEDYDLVILSGGYWYDDEVQQRATYAGELEMIRHTKTPVLGICLGMQLMQVAFSGDVPMLEEAQYGWADIELTPQGRRVLGTTGRLHVFKNHTRGVLSAQPDIDVLATSKDRAEIITHKKRRVLGVQFHPEAGEEPSRSELFNELVAEAFRRKVA